MGGNFLLSSILVIAFLIPATGAESSLEKRKKMTAAASARLAAYTDYVTFHDKYLKHIAIERVPDTPGHQTVETFIIDSMRNMSWDVEEDDFSAETPHGAKHFTNIIATQNPDAPRKMVFACHYDSKYLTGEKPFIGAIDSAVSCAMMLDLAESISSDRAITGLKNITLQLVFLDGSEAFETWTENDSLYGSRHLAEKWKQTKVDEDAAGNILDSIDIFVLLSLIGYKNPQFVSLFPSTNSEFEHLQRIEKERNDADAFGDSNHPYFADTPTHHMSIEDDQVPFARHGVSVLHLVPTPFPSVWHTAADDETALDQDSIVDLLMILRVFAKEYLTTHD